MNTYMKTLKAKQASEVVAQKSTSQMERDMIDLRLGKRKPKNAQEEQFLKDMQRAEKQGKIVYIPHD